ncbi:hypothetical protein ES705_16691 [subsurface metagenome]|nr:hypothetical protein [Methanosarcinales archaeon]
MNTKMKGKAIIGILLAAIMLASVMVAMVPTVSAVSKGDNFNYIGANLTETVLVGQNVQFNTTGANIWTDPENVKVLKFHDGFWYYYAGPWSGGTVYNVNWDPTLTLRATNTTAGTVNTSLAVEIPNIPLSLKVGTSEVSFIAVGTNLTIDTGGINLFDNDKVDLEIIDPDGFKIDHNPTDGQDFSNITVAALKAFGVATSNIATTGWKVGDYTFQIKTRPEYACGLDASSAIKDLIITTGEIDISAEKTTVIELQTIKLTVTGAAGDRIWLNATPSSPHVLFVGGVEDTPSSADGKDNFAGTIDADGTRTYVVKFNETGSYTIKVTVKSGPRYGDYDTVDISVEEKGVTFDMPTMVAIGERLMIKGHATSGERVTIAVDDRAYPELDRLVIDVNGQFEKEINTTTACGGLFSVPGSVRLKAFIDRPAVAPPYDDTSGETADGSAVILMLETHLNVTITKATVPPGDSFEIYGNASSNYVEIVTISPKGGNGTGMAGLYGTTIYTVPTFCNSTNYNFYKKIKVDSDADIGNYTILVLSPDRDEIYGSSSYSYIDSIMDLDGAGPELGAIDVSNKTQEEIAAIIEDIISAAGSDDFMCTGNIVVTHGIFDTGEGSYPSIMGTHNGTITIQRMYTYPCTGTGGHSEYAAFYEQDGTKIGEGRWKGYQSGDYHYITFDAPLTLEIGKTYNYTIRTGSYPQIIHAKSKDVTGGVINCTEFTDANGKKYNNWIPAIRLE